MTSTSTGTHTVIGVFGDVNSAERAVQALADVGIPRQEISIITRHGTSDTVVESAEPMESVSTGAGIGAAIGGAGGLLLSLAGIMIPGIGPVLAAGPLVAALGGAGIGATVGSLLGALTDLGVPADEAEAYAAGIRRGEVLVTVRADHDQAIAVQRTLDIEGAADVVDHPDTPAPTIPVPRGARIYRRSA